MDLRILRRFIISKKFNIYSYNKPRSLAIKFAPLICVDLCSDTFEGRLA
jgi:hypothetical protein